MDTTNTHDIDLTGYDDDFAQAKEPERNTEVPDGKYVVGVERVQIARAKKEPHQPMLKWQLQILDGAFRGRRLFRNNLFATRENLAWLKGDLKVCGLEITRVSELQPNLEKLLDCVLMVTVRNRKDAQGRDQSSVFFDKRIVDYQQSPDEADSGVGGGAPF